MPISVELNQWINILFYQDKFDYQSIWLAIKINDLDIGLAGSSIVQKQLPKADVRIKYIIL